MMLAFAVALCGMQDPDLSAVLASERRRVATIDRCGHELGRLCAWLVDLLNPDVIVLGTIGTAFFELFEPRIRPVIDAEAIPRAAAHVALRPSGLADRGNQTALAVARRLLESPGIG